MNGALSFPVCCFPFVSPRLSDHLAFLTYSLMNPVARASLLRPGARTLRPHWWRSRSPVGICVGTGFRASTAVSHARRGSTQFSPHWRYRHSIFPIALHSSVSYPRHLCSCRNTRFLEQEAQVCVRIRSGIPHPLSCLLLVDLDTRKFLSCTRFCLSPREFDRFLSNSLLVRLILPFQRSP